MTIIITETDYYKGKKKALFSSSNTKWREVFANEYGYDSAPIEQTIAKMNEYADYVNNTLKEECVFEVV